MKSLLRKRTLANRPLLQLAVPFGEWTRWWRLTISRTSYSVLVNWRCRWFGFNYWRPYRLGWWVRPTFVKVLSIEPISERRRKST